METEAKRFFLRYFVPFAFMMLLVLNSCVQEPDNNGQNQNVSSFTEIKTSSDFDWSSIQTVTLEVVGLPTTNEIKKTLKVMSLDSTAVFFSKLQTLSEDLSVQIVLPSSITKVKVVYGVIVKDVDVVNKTIQFDYLTVPDSEL